MSQGAPAQALAAVPSARGRPGPPNQGFSPAHPAPAASRPTYKHPRCHSQDNGPNGGDLDEDAEDRNSAHTLPPPSHRGSKPLGNGPSGHLSLREKGKCPSALKLNKTVSFKAAAGSDGTWPDLADGTTPVVSQAESDAHAMAHARGGTWPDISSAPAPSPAVCGSRTRRDGTSSKTARRLENGDMDGFHDHTTCDKEGPGRAVSRKGLKLDADGNTSHNGVRVKSRRSSALSGLASVLSAHKAASEPSAQKTAQSPALHVRRRTVGTTTWPRVV